MENQQNAAEEKVSEALAIYLKEIGHIPLLK